MSICRKRNKFISANMVKVEQNDELRAKTSHEVNFVYKFVPLTAPDKHMTTCEITRVV